MCEVFFISRPLPCSCRFSGQSEPCGNLTTVAVAVPYSGSVTISGAWVLLPVCDRCAYLRWSRSPLVQFG